ncbi:MAG: hypothetical protein ACR2NN_15265 [Bryobacteraceae bacterium]
MNPPFTKESESALRALLDTPVMSGCELAIRANLKPDQLPEALNPLLAAGMISANTSSTEASAMERAYFNLKPSARRYAEYAVL